VSAVAHLHGAGKRIVVIEDNEAAARLMSRILEARDDCEVHTAYNGSDGLALIRSIHPDLVITDLMMPDVDGFSVINTMKADPELNHIQIVVVTAKELTVKERAYLDTQVDMLLQKGSFLDEDFIEDLVDKLK
jgi:threonine synthase